MDILCPRLGAEWIGRISWLPRAPLGPIFMTGLYSVHRAYYHSGRPVIKIGPKGALGSHEIRPIHSAPSLGQSIDACSVLLCSVFNQSIIIGMGISSSCFKLFAWRESKTNWNNIYFACPFIRDWALSLYSTKTPLCSKRIYSSTGFYCFKNLYSLFSYYFTY